jgi:hypothetical protein
MPQVIVQVPPATPGGPTGVYQAFVHQRSELRDQLDRLQSQRSDLQQEIQQAVTETDKKGLESRLTQVDQHIQALDQAIAASDAEVAKAAAVPGAVVDPPREIPQGPPDEVYVLGGIFMIVIGFPIAFAFARRIWKKSVQTIISIPQDIYDRFARLDQAIDAVAIEVERIGEGQRFLTKLQSERALGAGAAEPISEQRASREHVKKGSANS